MNHNLLSKSIKRRAQFLVALRELRTSGRENCMTKNIQKDGYSREAWLWWNSRQMGITIHATLLRTTWNVLVLPWRENLDPFHWSIRILRAESLTHSSMPSSINQLLPILCMKFWSTESLFLHISSVLLSYLKIVSYWLVSRLWSYVRPCPSCRGLRQQIPRRFQ